MPRGNLGLIWAFPSHFGVYVKISQVPKERGLESAAQGSHPGKLAIACLLITQLCPQFHESTNVIATDTEAQCPFSVAVSIEIDQAAIAQLGERQTEDLKVPGSIPGLGMVI